MPTRHDKLSRAMGHNPHTIRAANQLLTLMITRVTNRPPASATIYRQARRRILNDPRGAALAPECVLQCPEIDDVWRYIKRQQPPLSTYAQRRRYLTDQFTPLLTDQALVSPGPDSLSRTPKRTSDRSREHANMTEKWADYLITAVRLNPGGTHIRAVQIRRDKGQSVGFPSQATRAEILAMLERGLTFCTATNNGHGCWLKGAQVRTIFIDGQEFIRTKADNVKADNLDELPAL